MATRWVALLRGINVGGRHSLPMKSLAALLEGLGAAGVRTYIQSGNVVFTHREGNAAKLAGKITAAIEAGFGFAPAVMLLPADALRAATAANPYPAACAVGASLHLWFLDAAPASADLDALAALRTGGEAFTLKGQVFYLHAPAGIGKSKLAEKVERHLGVKGTARNWNTVAALLGMLEG